MTPFPLDGGRAGVGGGSADVRPVIARARRLRRETTLGERVLWKALRQTDLHVRRQVPIGRYVVDFAIHSARLIIEVDGPHHELPGRPERDAERDLWLRSQNYVVLRFSADAVIGNPDAIAASILAAAAPPPSPALPPSRGKGEV